MDRDTANLIVRSLVGRLRRDGSAYVLPDGRLSELEIQALSILAPDLAVSPSTSSNSGDLIESKIEPRSQSEVRSSFVERPAASQPSLLRNAMNINGPDEKHIRLCIDFGTALSKAWAAYETINQTIPLNLGRAAGEIDSLTLPSTIFISNSGRIYFGSSADRQYRQELTAERSCFDNIKRILSDAEVDQDLDEVSVSRAIDPTESGVTKGELLVLYLAWFTDHALKALRVAAEEDAEGEYIPQLDILRYVRRRFAIPCFENAVNETASSEARSKWAKRVLRKSMLRAQVVADTLSDRWSSLSLIEALPLLRQARNFDETSLNHLLVNEESVREPIAAGASRFDDELGDQAGQGRRYLLVIDAGAGTTDFAMFTVVVGGDDNEDRRYALISPSVKMSRIAGNHVDEVLRPLFLMAAGVDPSTGSPRSDQDFALIKTDLNSQIRYLKQVLFSEREVTFNLTANISGTLRMEDVLSNPAYLQLGGELKNIRRTILSDLFPGDFLARVRESNERTGRHMPIYVLLTGGSSSVPVVAELAEGELELEEAKFAFVKVKDLPDWIETLPREIQDLISAPYRQCAVAIGGTAPELPEQIGDIRRIFSPVPNVPRKLERYQVTGV